MPKLLIPTRRLNRIPRETRDRHEYCFFLHDQCVRVLLEYERERCHIVHFEFRDAAEQEAFQRAAKQTDSVTALRQIGREDEARRVVMNTVTMAMVSDCLHHIYEALRCMEKRKFIVGLNLLRKPLLDSLIFMAWMLSDAAEFYDAFTKSSPQGLESSVLGRQRGRIITGSLAKTALPPLIKADDIKALLFDSKNEQGLYWLLQRAVHLITTFRPEFATEPENFNFIFKSHADDDVLLGIYDTLPTVMLYLAHIIIELFNCIHPMDSGAKSAFSVRSTLGYQLIENERVHEIEQKLSTISGHFPCARCGAEPRFTRQNAIRTVLANSVRCTKCGTISGIPFVWMF